jgi:catechol 2,3-dioxygenase-like lactoylglutathione lyase family enzyme
MTIHAIHHVQLPLGRVAQQAVRDFYNGLLGLLELPHPQRQALRFLAGNQRIDLVPDDSTHPTSPVSHLALEVVGLPGLRNRLLEAGYTLDESRPLPGHLRFYVQDPAGNGLEFLEPDDSQSQTV